MLVIGFGQLLQSRTEIIMGPLATMYNTLRGRKCSMDYTFFNIPECPALLGGNYMPLSKIFYYLNTQFMTIPLPNPPRGR